MPTISVDEVVVLLQAQTAAHDAALTKSADLYEQSMARIKRAAAGLESAEETTVRNTIARRLRLDAAVRGSTNTIVTQSGKAANATRNLGRQIADVGVGLGGGQNPFLILAQQAPQIADALADTEGKAASFARFFAGPWGAALLAAASIAGIFIGKLFEQGDADKHTKTEQEELTKAVQSYQDALGGAVSNQLVNLRLTEQQANHYLQLAQNANKAARAQAASALAGVQSPTGADPNEGDAAGVNLFVASRKADATAKALRKKQVLARLNAFNTAQEANEAIADPNDPAQAKRARILNAENEFARRTQNRKVGLATGTISSKTAAAQDLAERQALNRLRDQDTNDKADQAADRKKAAAERALETAANKRETAARKAEGDQKAFDDETAGLKEKIASATAKQAVGTDAIAAAAVAAAEDFKVKEDVRIGHMESLNHLSAHQVELLRAQNVQLLAATKAGVEAVRLSADQKDIADLAIVFLGIQRTQLEDEISIADTTEARRKLALELLDNENAIKLVQLRRIADDAKADPAKRQIAETQIAALGPQAKGAQATIMRQTETQTEAYLRQLNSATPASLSAEFDDQAIGHLKDFNSELAKSVTSALHLHGIFGQIVSDLLEIAIRQTLIRPLANALFGSGAGGPGGGGLLSSVFGHLFGRAAGGNVVGGRTYRVNENRVEAFRAPQSGKIIPLGPMGAPSGAGGTQINQTFVLDARYGITTPELIRHVNSVAKSAAVQAASISYKSAVDAGPGRLARQQTLGS